MLLMQCSVQLPGMPGEKRRAVLSAPSLLAHDDGVDGDGLQLLRGGARHEESLSGDDAVVHHEVGLAGSRQDQRGRSGSVYPIRIHSSTPRCFH